MRPSLDCPEFGRCASFPHTYTPAHRQPNDERHNDSLDLNHHVFLLLNDNKLYHAPLDNPQSVLDLGTGTGIWAMYDPSFRKPPFPRLNLLLPDA